MRRQASKSLDLTDLREALLDGKVWSGIGVVYVPDGEEKHYYFDADGDVFISVQLMPNGEPLDDCRLGSFGGGAGIGFWVIPPVGTEVVLMIPQGEFEAGPVIVGTCSTGKVPDGLTETTAVIAIKQGGKILIHDGTANQAEPLVKKSEHDGHSHPLPPMFVMVGMAKVPVQVDAPPAASPGDTKGAPAVTGTTVLGAK